MLAKQMKADGHDLLLLAQPENIAWLFNIRADDVPHTPFALSFGLLHKTRFDWYIDKARVSAEVAAHVGTGLKLHAPDKLAGHLRGLKAKTLAYDPLTTPAWFAQQLTMPPLPALPTRAPCRKPKRPKRK